MPSSARTNAVLEKLQDRLDNLEQRLSYEEDVLQRQYLLQKHRDLQLKRTELEGLFFWVAWRGVLTQDWTQKTIFLLERYKTTSGKIKTCRNSCNPA